MAREWLAENGASYWTRMKVQYDKRWETHRTEAFNIGDRVCVRVFKAKSKAAHPKLAHDWQGPYRVPEVPIEIDYTPVKGKTRRGKRRGRHRLQANDDVKRCRNLDEGWIERKFDTCCGQPIFLKVMLGGALRSKILQYKWPLPRSVVPPPREVERMYNPRALKSKLSKATDFERFTGSIYFGISKAHTIPTRSRYQQGNSPPTKLTECIRDKEKDMLRA
ncbi:unnamed protein product [Nippostrongylus brasiliensis]|uniref:Reverse transcriptase n=1 Tax=Nippostrongylus brasiliensis TaxID=27835 RepID=A0A0N4YLT0_NIPBR|nr:unnamed protein product [Nippostrongylus brasiliensis]